jgi:aminotransferase
MPDLPRISLFGECITRKCTIKAIEKGAYNLSQGFPDAEPQDEIKNAACKAILEGPNQYADMRGAPNLRLAVARKYNEKYLMDWVNADDNVTITCGSTEAMVAAILATVGPGEEIIIQEPTYENYPPQALIAGGIIKHLTVNPPNWKITRESLEKVFNNNTKAIILNNPNNPTGRVYSIDELELIAEFALRFDSFVLVDEIYEHLVWDNNEHISFSKIKGMKNSNYSPP